MSLTSPIKGVAKEHARGRAVGDTLSIAKDWLDVH